MEILNADGTPLPRRRLRKKRSSWALGRALLAPLAVAIALPLAAILILPDRTSTTESMLAVSGRVDGLGDPGDFGTVPESGTLALLGVGFAGAVLRLRRTGLRRR